MIKISLTSILSTFDRCHKGVSISFSLSLFDLSQTILLAIAWIEIVTQLLQELLVLLVMLNFLFILRDLTSKLSFFLLLIVNG